MTQPTITVFSKPACVQCNMVKRWLKLHELDYDEIDVTAEGNEGYLNTVLALGYLTAPVTLVSRAEDPTTYDHFGGFDPGELAKLLP